MKFWSILIIFLLFFSLRGIAQTSEAIVLGNVAKEGYALNASYGPFATGFPFTFYGNTYNDFYVTSSGLVLFGSGSTDGSEDPIPTAGTPNNFIAAFWDQLVIDGTGKILYNTIGAAPNRKLIIQFKNMGFYTGPVYMGTFSVILYETSNIIKVQFRLVSDRSSVRANGESAAIGIENSGGTAGLQYAYHINDAVSTRTAISFTPEGPGYTNYTLDSDADYESIFLTKNISLPEPGITMLLNPPHDAVIGSDFNFTWSDAGNSASYSLLISTSSDLGGATTYSAGSNLSYSVTGLALNTIYYWGVFSTNATGTTWCEINKFTISANPPLVAVPQTVWVEKNHEKTIKLEYTGGDASSKTAVLTTLPVQGHLYQYNAGAKGDLITSAQTALTDPERNVIYLADGNSGSNAGNFRFKITDSSGDSPDTLVKVTVNPPGIPNLLYTAKNLNIELQFDRIMADPTGKDGQFSVIVNDNPYPISSLSLKNGDPYTISVNLTTPLAGTETVSISYAAGSITSAEGGLLASFTSQPVTLTAQTIYFLQSLSKKYNESPLTLTATSSSGLSMTYSSSNLSVATISGNQVTFHTTGTSDLTARQAGNTTFAPAKFIKTLTVDKVDQTISFSLLPEKTYGDDDFTPTATASSGLTVTYSSDNPSVATIVSGNIHITGAGTSLITASQAGNSIWNPVSVTQLFTVNKAEQTITFSSLPIKTFGDADFTPSCSSSSGLSVILNSNNTSVASVTGGIIHITGAGTALITASQPGNSNYNAATDVQQNLTVNKADQVITFNPLPSKTYGDPDFASSVTVSSGLSITLASNNTSVATIIGGNIHITGSGTADITATQPGNINFNPASDEIQTLNVSKADLIFTADDKSKEFNTPNPVLTYTISGFVNGEDQSVLDFLPDIQTTAIQNSPIGTYPVTLSGGNDNNYSYIFVPGTLSVTRFQQTISFTGFPEKLLVKDSFTLVATSSSGLTVLFESMDTRKAIITGDQITGVSQGSVEIRAYHPGDQDYDPAEAFATVEVWSTHKDILYLFTPNNDGINDYWELPDIVTWGKCEVKVYNRWGKLVFADADYNNLWNGISNGNPLPEGAYFFIIKTENAGTVKGTINIVR